MPTIQNYSDFLRNFKSAKFKKLYDSQDHILTEYGANFSAKSDVAVELLTGAGKTLIALLIAEAWRQVDKKVAILSANKTLARQMEAECNELGIPSVLMEGRGVDIPSQDKRAYHRCRKIAVMNYWVYFNQRPVLDNADLLIMDDAHLAEHCLHSLWSVDINRHEHEPLFKSLVTELVNAFPEYTVLHDALNDDPPNTTPPELLSFIDQVRICTRIKEIVDSSPLRESNTDLRFRWGRLRNSLNEANIYLSVNSIWIRPYIYPLSANSHYSDAKQRLYMSATIGEPSDLSRRLGSLPIEKIPVPDEYAQTTSGRRLIVMNRIEDVDIPERLQLAILEVLRSCPKSVWMCTSRASAIRFCQAFIDWLDNNGFKDHPTWLLTSLGDEVDQFKKAAKGHLFVAGRFDGMDFKDNECRLVVLSTLPRAINTQEEFLCAYLRDSGFMRKRLNQRIVQALGRCNRSPGDFSVYVLADRRFASHFGRESNRVGLSKNMISEIDLAEDMADFELADLKSRVKSFINGNFADYDRKLDEVADDIPDKTETDPLSEIVQNEVHGWTALFSSQNYGIAAQSFEKCYEKAKEANIREFGAFYGWCWAKARYLEACKSGECAKADALILLEEAINRGGVSSWFNRMRASLNRERQVSEDRSTVTTEEYRQAIIRAFDNLLEQLGTRGKRFEKWCNRLTEELDAPKHDQCSEGLRKLGSLIGYDSLRPRHNSATDCRWRGSFGSVKEIFTFELKIEQEPTTKICSSDLGQVHIQMTRANTEFAHLGYSVTGSIITHLREIEPDAESSAGAVRIIQKQAILDLWLLIRQRLSQYRSQWSLDDINARRQAAVALRPKLPKEGWLKDVLAQDQRFITSDLLLKHWSV